MNYNELYLEIKKRNEEKFKEEKRRDAKELGMLIRNEQLGEKAYLKMATIMQIKSKNIFYRAEDEQTKEAIINGFKELYKDDNKILEHSEEIVNLMLETLDIIEKKYNTINIKPPIKPKSKAKDIYGISQRQIIELVGSENLKQTINKFKWFISTIIKQQDAKLVIHNTSKIMLKKKKQEIAGYEDLRALSIMPATIMAFDKIIALAIDKENKSKMSPNQHGGREKQGTNTAKIAMYYKMQTKGFNKILLIDLKKAFDMVNRKILQSDIINKFKISDTTKILLNITKIYDNINIQVEQEKIHPTRGVPQGSVFGPTLFLIYIDDILKQIEQNQKIHIQAFIDDDIAIASNDILELQNTFNKIKSLIKQKSMEINSQKCELITNNLEDTIIDPDSNTSVKTIPQSKYLGQKINNEFKTEDIIFKHNYQSIYQLIKTSETFITTRSRIKLFKTYIKAKYNHLLPLIALNGDVETTWKQIRKTIFNDILKRSTQPKESAGLLGCSYYSIILRPLIKMMDQESESDNQDVYMFIAEASKKAMLYWISTEINHNQEIISAVEKFVNKNIYLNLKQWDEITQKDAIIRMYKNINIPQNYQRLKDLKYPIIIEILSNAPIHIMKQNIKNNIILKKDEQTFKKTIANQINRYIITTIIGKENPPSISKPQDNEDINDIIEYQQTYDLCAIDKLYQIKDEINVNNESIIKEIININIKTPKDKDPVLGNKMEKIIEWTRQNIQHGQKKSGNGSN